MRTTSLLALAGALATAVACGSAEAPAPVAACDLGVALTAEECASAHGLALDPALPPSRGNAKADDPNAALLGFRVFFDQRFSANQGVRCATCHLPEDAFADGKPVSTGLAQVARNAPTALNAARMPVVFWDGRADSLWSQPLFAFENPKEMGFTRLELAHLVARLYRPEYERVFGPLPALDDAARFPARGKPGDAAFDAMAAADQDAIDRVAANVGKALEAYVRKLAAGPARLDRFLAGDASALSDAEKRGLAVFVRAGCLDCHGGPMLSDMEFHDLGVPTPPGVEPDPGRQGAVAILRASPFNGEGPYVDGPAYPLPPDPGPEALGAFRTPTLRNVTRTAPYMHDGSIATLKDAVAFHLAGGGRGRPDTLGEVDPKLTPRAVPESDVDDLLAFLGALEGAYPAAPWNDWPR